MYRPISLVVESTRVRRGILDKLVMGSVTQKRMAAYFSPCLGDRE